MYCKHWHHLLCYLLWAYCDPNSSGLIVNDEQRLQISEIEAALQIAEEEFDQEDTEKLIFNLSIALVEQPMSSWPFHNPLLYFLSILLECIGRLCVAYIVKTEPFL